MNMGNVDRLRNRSAEVLFHLYEMSGSDTALRFNPDELLDDLGFEEAEFVSILNFLEESDYIRVPKHEGGGLPLSIYLTFSGINEAERIYQQNMANMTPIEEGNTLEVFISHSGLDVKIAKRVITLIRAALNLPSETIRCTSVDGFRLPAGISTDERLRLEIHESRAFIGIITPNSLESVYVLFELGARWGARKSMIPLLACGVDVNTLKAPLSAINALSCDHPAQLHQFVEDLARILGKPLDRPAAYQKCIDELGKESLECGQSIASTHGATSKKISSNLGAIEEVKRADLRARLGRLGSWKGEMIVISNHGSSEARNVKVKIDGIPITEHAIVYGEHQEIMKIGPRHEIGYKIALHKGTPDMVRITITWEDDSGADRRYEEMVNL
ncbi:MAG: toll/interleukin-1 receptor domain-containing protein [Rhodothermales bacterium]